MRAPPRSMSTLAGVLWRMQLSVVFGTDKRKVTQGFILFRLRRRARRSSQREKGWIAGPSLVGAYVVLTAKRDSTP